MILSIRIDAKLLELDETGEMFIRYTPVLASVHGGEIPGPVFDCGLHDGEEAHAESRRKAAANLRASLAVLLERSRP